MLTPEQIKNLKPGDPIVINTEIHHVDKYGTIWFNARTKYCTLNLDAISPELVSLPSEHGTSVPTPKYDPARKFCKGDIVKRRTVDGRTDPDLPEDIPLAVTTDEARHGNVRVQEPNGRSVSTKAVFLELVSPVEEREAYTIELAVSGKGTDYRIKKDGVIICAYSCAHPNAKAAAEAECDRLNAE